MDALDLLGYFASGRARRRGGACGKENMKMDETYLDISRFIHEKAAFWRWDVDGLAEILEQHFIPRAAATPEKPVVRIGREGTGVTWQVSGKDSATVVRPSAGRAEDVEAGLRLAFRAAGYTVEPFPTSKPVVTAAEWEAIEFCNPGAKCVFRYENVVFSSTEVESFTVDDDVEWSGYGLRRIIGGLDERFRDIDPRESLVLNPRYTPDPVIPPEEIALMWKGGNVHERVIGISIFDNPWRESLREIPEE